MTKDQVRSTEEAISTERALDLALEALEIELAVDMTNGAKVGEAAELMCEAITAIKQARALDKKAAVVEPHKNARELGLDYEPVDGTQVSKVWWDGEKLMAKPIPREDFYQPAVPDAFGTREGEHPQYIQGWNDCRQAMLEMKK